LPFEYLPHARKETTQHGGNTKLIVISRFENGGNPLFARFRIERRFAGYLSAGGRLS
jgi:hypothetical protein